MDYSKIHQSLYTPTAQLLGEIHKIHLESYKRMDSLSFSKEGMRTTRTAFGSEVGQDVLHWWIANKEGNIEDLKIKTEDTLNAVQQLKQDSKNLRPNSIKKYEDIIKQLGEFIESHSTIIEKLYGFVNWLYKKDPLAPCILYSYRVWGSSRISDRHFDLEKVKEPPNQNILVDIFCGLWMGGFYTRERIQMGISAEIYQGIDPCDLPTSGKIAIPRNKLLYETAITIFGEFSNYFEKIRDSLRNIIIEIEKKSSVNNLLYNDCFWNNFIKTVSGLAKPESLWDFKQTLDMWHIKEKIEKTKKEIRFAEEIACLANSSGGVLLVGIADSYPREIVGVGDNLSELESRMKYSRDVITNYVTYPKDIVHMQIVPVEDGNGGIKNCLVIAIKQTCEVVAVCNGDGKYTYPLRQETGLARVDQKMIQDQKGTIVADNYDFLEIFKQMLLENKA